MPNAFFPFPCAVGVRFPAILAQYTSLPHLLQVFESTVRPERVRMVVMVAGVGCHVVIFPSGRTFDHFGGKNSYLKRVVKTLILVELWHLVKILVELSTKFIILCFSMSKKAVCL